MLDIQVAHMTEREIDDHYRRREEESRRRYDMLQVKREVREERGRLLRLVFATVLILVICTSFLQLDFQVQQRIYKVSELQKEVDELRLENADAKKRIEDAGNLQTVQRKAASFGMGYPREGNVVYYTLEEHDYMFQTGEIPET